jgi:pectate disaccharide-lyase
MPHNLVPAARRLALAAIASALTLSVVGAHDAHAADAGMLELYDTASDRGIGQLADGDTVSLDALPDTLDIHADARSGRTSSLRFCYDGGCRVENSAPWTLDNTSDGRAFRLAEGSHTLTITAYSADNGGGSALGANTVRFKVVAGTAKPAPPQPPLESTPAGPQLYVSPSGSDASSCTSAAPCRQLSRANRLAKPGTTVNVAPGSYAQPTLSTSGTASARIRYVSTQPWGARIAGSRYTAVAVSGAYVDFVGFDVTGDSSVATGIGISGNYSRAIGNHVHDIKRSCNPNGGIVTHTGHDMEVIRNYVHDNGVGARDGSCRLFHGVYLSRPGDKAINNVIARNLGDGVSSWHAASRLTVVNNTVVANGGIGVNLGGVDGNRGSFVANNIAVRNALPGITERGSSGPNTFRSNLTWENRGGDSISPRSGGSATGTLIADPLFANAGADDYRLQSGSPAADSGTTSSAPPTDYVQRSRRGGGGVSLGAYER